MIPRLHSVAAGISWQSRRRRITALPLAGTLRLQWRPLELVDMDRLDAFVCAQSKEDRRMRYHVAVNGLDRRWFTSLIAGRMTGAHAFAACAPSADGAGIVAEATLALDAAGGVADLALMVGASSRRRGVGWWCLQQLRSEARALCAGTLRAEVLPENTGMLGLLDRAGFAQAVSHGGLSLMVLEQPLHGESASGASEFRHETWLQRLARRVQAR